MADLQVISEISCRRESMKEKIVINFFDDPREKSVESMAAYFQLDKNLLSKYIEDFEKNGIAVKDFVSAFGINLSQYDSSLIEIICRHMTSMTEEGIEDIRTKGLLDLTHLLMNDTVLSRFLKRNNVIFDVKSRELFVDGQAYRITTAEEDCLICVEKKEIRCGRFERCDIREKMDSVGRKIYQLGGTLEFFVSGSKADMEHYSVIHLNPEILETLDQLLAEIKVRANRDEPFALSYKWREQERKTYILQFAVNLSDVEGLCVCDYNNAYYEFQELLDICGYSQNDYIMELIPDRFYQNMRLIEWFLGTDYGYQFGSLLRGKTVPAEKIQVKDAYVK